MCAQQRSPTTWALRARQVFLGPRSRHQFLCRDMVGAGTRLVLGRDVILRSRRGQPLGVLRHGLWRRDTKAACELKSVATKGSFWGVAT